MNRIRGFKIRLRKREILKTLKYNSKYATNIDQDLESLIQQQIENAYTLIDPSVVYKSFSNSSEKFETIKNEILFGSRKLKEILEKSCAFSLMAVTIGKELENEVNRVKNKNLTSAFVLDAAGSEAAEQSANFVSKILMEEASKQECRLGARFSPGYGDWPIEASKKIFEFIDTLKIELKLTPEGILIPRKSITAIQAWIPEKS